MKKMLIAALLAGTAAAPLAAQAQDTATATTQTTVPTTAPAGAAAPTPTPAPAAEALPALPGEATPVAGATVYGNTGQEVGTIKSVSGTSFVLMVGTVPATLPANALYKSSKGLTVSMTKAALEQAVGAASAQADAKKEAAFTTGASVMSKDNVPVATIEKVEGDNVTLDVSGGGSVGLAKRYFTLTPTGGLALILNAADFQSAVAKATGGASATSDAGTADAAASAGTAATTGQ